MTHGEVMRPSDEPQGEISVKKARPHPCPLPRGEGETHAVLLRNSRPNWLDDHPENVSRPAVISSPGGEDKGEGGL